MSLINEALKKAQKQRTGESAPLPAIGGESAERIARRAKPAGFYTLLLRIGIVGTILIVVIIGGIALLRKKPATQQPAIVSVETPAKPVEVAATKPAAPVTPAPSLVVPVATPVAPPKAEVPVVKTETPKPAATPTTVAIVVPAKPEPVKPAAPPAKLEPRAINFIESLRVAGIRASTTDSKVLMNDRVYRIGSMVEHEMGLKLTGITANSLTFEDERGGTYTRTF